MISLPTATGVELGDVSVLSTASPATLMVSNSTSMLDSVKKQSGLALLFKVEPDAWVMAIFCQSQTSGYFITLGSHQVRGYVEEGAAHQPPHLGPEDVETKKGDGGKVDENIKL